MQIFSQTKKFIMTNENKGLQVVSADKDIALKSLTIEDLLQKAAKLKDNSVTFSQIPDPSTMPYYSASTELKKGGEAKFIFAALIVLEVVDETTGEIKDAPTAILVDENGEFFKNQSFGVTNFCATLNSGTAFKLCYIETRKSKTNAMRKVDVITCYLETAS